MFDLMTRVSGSDGGSNPTEKRKVTGSTPVPTTTDGQAKRLAIACFSASSAGPPVVPPLALFDRVSPSFVARSSRGRSHVTERLYAATVIVRVWLERRPEDDVDQLRACAWGDGRWTGRLLADESGAVVRADAGRHDPADGFVTAAILLRDRVRQGEWPDRLSYDPTAQRTEPAVPPPATPPVRRRSPTRPGFGLGTLAERARRNRS